MNYKDIRKGMKVDWQVGDRVIKDCTITMEPWYMDMTWVCMVDKVDRCVPCAQLDTVRY